MNAPTRPTAEIARLGKEIYHRDIRLKAEACHFGEYVAIDVKPGEWAIANSNCEKLGRMRMQGPSAVDILRFGLHVSACDKVPLPTHQLFRRTQ